MIKSSALYQVCRIRKYILRNFYNININYFNVYNSDYVKWHLRVYKQREVIRHQRLLNENLEFKAFQFNSCKQA